VRTGTISEQIDGTTTVQVVEQAGELDVLRAQLSQARAEVGSAAPLRPFTYRGELLPFEPSSYQQAVIDEVLDGSGDIVVNAVAGSGKTATLELLARYIKSKAMFVAFNAHIAKELNAKLKPYGMSARTLHSVGFGALRYKFKFSTKPEPSKYRRLAREIQDDIARCSAVNGVRLSSSLCSLLATEYPLGELLQLVGHLRTTLAEVVDRPTVMALANQYAIGVEPGMMVFYVQALRYMLKRGAAEIAEGLVDFTDMIWGPWVHNCKPFQLSWVLVDEAQDLNPAQLDLAMRCRYRNGRMLFVGDRSQAIYGFAGAMADGIDQIVEATGAKELPLSTCYRCPTTHLELAREIVPQIEAAPGARQGVIGGCSEEQVMEVVAPGDIVLCRTTAPLIKLCFALLLAGVSARVRGRKIGEALVALIERLAKRRAFKYAEMDRAVALWLKRESAKVLRRNGGDLEDSQLQGLQDRADTVMALWSGSDATSIAGLTQDIEGLFSNDRPSVWLSTVHRAKGLEAEVVYILRPDLMPLPFARKGWQVQQEYNLLYVALTRAKRALVMVEGSA
jgi:hypothetical protein